jgi:acyl carrier protein
MNREQITTSLYEVIFELFEDVLPPITDAQQLESQLGLDSMDRVELLNTLEDTFNVTFKHPDDRNLTSPNTTVGQLVGAIETLMAMKGTPQ